MTVMQDLAPGQIRPSPTNPRKTFTGLDELTASVLAHGVIVPVEVRPTPATSKAKEPFELIVGERRWRAAAKAKIATIPCVVRELTDQEVLEHQLIENLQRRDVHPIEEAEGYELLLEKHSYDVDGIAKKTGKSRAYIYARLKLGALAPGPRQAFLDDRLSASIALLIARIPDVGLQEKATKEILGEPDALMAAEEGKGVDQDDPLSWERRGLRVDDDELAGPTSVSIDARGRGTKLEHLPMSVREAQIHLRRRYMLRLELATFSLADTQLVASAGACTTCQYRTGNQRELFAEVSSADICTSPTCYAAKTKAAWEEKASAAKAQGQKVVAQEKTSRMFSPVDGRTVAGNSPYVDPKAQVPRDLVPMGTKAPTWEKLLGKKLSTPTVLVQDQTGAARELLDRNAAVKVLREAGKIDKPVKPRESAGAGAQNDWAEQQKREEKKRAIRERAHEALTRAAFDKLATTTDEKKELAQWKWLVTTIVEREAPDLAIDLLGVKKADEIPAIVTSASRARVVLFGILFAELAAHKWSEPHKDGPMRAAVRLLGLDYDKATEEAKKVAAVAEKAEAQVDAKKAEKKAPAKKVAKRGA